MNELSEVGKQIRDKILIPRWITQKEFAATLGVHRSTISLVNRGKLKLSEELRQKIYRRFRVKIED